MQLSVYYKTELTIIFRKMLNNYELCTAEPVPTGVRAGRLYPVDQAAVRRELFYSADGFPRMEQFAFLF